MASTSHDLTELSIDLCWRQWTTLGVAGTTRQNSNAVIDPEALVLFTAALDDADPRLRDEATDWCVQFGPRLVSATRLRNLLAREPESTQRAAGEFLATVNASSATRWQVPHAASPRPVEVSGKSRLGPIKKEPALLRLQLRSLFGVTARAEILLALLAAKAEHRGLLSASDLVSTGYTKRNVALVLSDLALAGLLTERRAGNQLRYRLDHEAALCSMVPGTRTATHTRWDLRLPIIAAARRMVDSTAGKSAATRSVEAKRLVVAIDASLRALDLTPPEVEAPTTYQDEVVAWIAAHVVPGSL